MKKIFVVGLAIVAMSAAAPVSAKKMKKEAAPAASPMMMGNTSAADKAMWKKNQHDSGVK